MTRLILDHFRRWWWVLVPAGALCFGLGWNICALGGKSSAFWALVLSLWVGATLLAFDMKQGLVRTLLTLPLTARQIGRGWWVATVGIPALAMAALLVSGAALWSRFHPDKALPVSALAAACLFSLLWLGNSFTSIYGMTNELFGNWRERTSIGILSLLSMIMLFGSMLLAQQLFDNPVFFSVFFGIGLMVTVASWFRAEKFVLGRASFRLPEVASKLPLAEHRPESGGGIPFLMRTTFVRGFVYLAVLVGLMTLLSFRRDSGISHDINMILFARMGSVMSAFLIVLYHALPALRQLRVLRALPIHATQLAAVIISLALLPLMAIGGVSVVVAGLVFGKAAVISTLKSYAFILAPAALSMFLATWLGTGRTVYILLFVIIIAWGTLTPIVEASQFFAQFPAVLVSALLVLCVLLSFLLTRLALVHSSRTYRTQRVQAEL